MRKIFLAVLLFCSFISFATKRYVSNSGTNSGAGGIGAPWGTGAYAVANCGATDTIVFLAGTHNITAVITLPAGVSLEGIDTTAILTSSVFTTEFEYLIVATSPEGTNGNQHISKLKFDGNNLSVANAILVRGRSNFSIYNCAAQNFHYTFCAMGGRNDTNDGPPTTYATGNSFYNNTIRNCAHADFNYGRGELYLGGQSGFLYHDNKAWEGGRATAANGWNIKCQLNAGYIKNMKIYNSSFEVPKFPYAENGQANYFNFCIEMFNEFGIELYNNTFKGCIDFNEQRPGVDGYSIYAHNNTFGRSTRGIGRESGIILESDTDSARVEFNKFSNVADIVLFSFHSNGGDTVKSISIKNNFCDSTGSGDGARHGGLVQWITQNDGDHYNVKDVNVKNNTLLALQDGSSEPFFGCVLPCGGNTINAKFWDNIIVGTSYYAYVVNNTLGGVTGSSVRNNLLYQNGFGGGNAVLVSAGGGTPYTISSTIVATPSLNVAGIPQPGSAALLAGTDLKDIGFTGGGATPDVTAPTVTSTNPAAGAVNVTAGAYNIVINFSEGMTGLNSTNITGISGSITAGGSYASIAAVLAAGTTYTITVGTGVTDASGNHLAAPYVFSFTTGSLVAPPDPTDTWVPVPYLLLKRQ